MSRTLAEKVTIVKAILRLTDNSEDNLLETYLQCAAQEIIYWRYSYVTNGENIPSEVPAEYEMTQVNAVVAGYSIAGAEGEVTHSENGISRTFKYEDMISYIRSHVIPIARVIG